MRWVTRHPEDRALNRFADGELSENELARVSDHLARCPRCRAEVALVRRLGDSARTLPAPLATDEILRRALARRAGGERVLLPTSDAGAPRPRPVTRFAPAAIAALLTLMIASLVVSVRVLEADRPALRLYPERPTAGEALRVEYHGGALFGDQTHLKLRARFRTAEDRHWQLLAGVLVRGDDGLYRTEVQLPDSVVYAAFAVEDLHAERLDSNNRELWDVMIHRDDRPTLGAMTARLRDLERRDWGEAYAITKQMTEMYPDSAQSWAIRFSFEISLFDRDSVSLVHQRQLERLERLLASDQRVSHEQVAWLGTYAAVLGDLDSAGRWIREAVDRAPTSPRTAEAEAIFLSLRHADELDEVLSRLDRAWSRLETPSLALANVGWQAGVEAKDPVLTQRWLMRYLRIRPSEQLSFLPRAYSIADDLLRESLADWVDRLLSQSAESVEGARPLDMLPDAHLRRQAEDMQRALAAVAVVASERGRQGEAAEFARLGAQLAWEPTALLQIYDILAPAQETDLVIEVLSRAAADPLTAEGAQARARKSGLDDLPQWNELVLEARTRLSRHVMRDAVIRYVDPAVQVEDQRGMVRLAELREGRVTVVGFMYRYCAPALEDLSRMASLARMIEERGGRFILVDVDPDQGLNEYLRHHNIPLSAYLDRSGDARSAFSSSSAPDYYVLDSDGRIRFEHSRLDEVLRQVEALQRLESTGNVAVVE